MKPLKQTKIWIKLKLILFKDLYNGYAFKFAKKNKKDLTFHYSLELSQEIKKTETLENKLFNIKLASEKINEYIILPDQIFSFWKIVGNPETTLKKSRSIVRGEIVNEVGGGLCQVSGIIYHMSILCGLEILQRFNHSIDLYTDETRFTPLGTDATVVYASKDLRIKNNFPFPIKFDFIATDETLTLKLLSNEKILMKNLEYQIQKNEADTVAFVRDEKSIINKSVYKNNN